MKTEWQWSSFEDLSKEDWYAIVARRQEVFIIEQNCVYPDIDGVDLKAFHLLGWRGEGSNKALAAYLRVVFPGVKYAEVSLGRVLSAPAMRSTGVGRELVAQGIARAEKQFPGLDIRISAQLYLERFYRSFGFACTSEPYDEDGIPHVEMLRPHSNTAKP
ncbi:MAG: GNAT family N-acetyltransferase [Burkholderiaceae bacterium]|nr:GNAT family N-acetyltransferase [Burkholderiaceae bacterium]